MDLIVWMAIGILSLIIFLTYKKNMFFKKLGHFILKVFIAVILIFLLAMFIDNEAIRDRMSDLGANAWSIIVDKVNSG